MELMIVGFDSEHEADAALRRVDAAASTHGSPLEALAVVSHPTDPTMVLDGAAATAGRGAPAGCVLSLLPLVARSGGPATAIGGVVRGVLAALGGDAVDNAMMRALARSVTEWPSVLVGLGDETAIATSVPAARPGDAVREAVPEATRSLVRLVSSLSPDDIENSLLPAPV